MLGSRQLSRQNLFFAAVGLSIFLFTSLWLIAAPGSQESVSAVSNDRPEKEITQPKLHLLLPANNRDVNLCKLLLSAHIHEYPTPTLIAWNEVFDKDYLLGAGSHVAKISKVLEYLKDLPRDADEDLILMMDAFDIWFQLEPEVLISRYFQMNDAADHRISERMGKAAEVEEIKQKIIFGAGKRCAPNQVHTIACYPVPQSPVPDNIYGANTDTIMGRNKYTSQRQRFLNSGYIIGPAKDMRTVFEAAWDMVENWPNPDPNDNGSHGSDFMYHGSDQSVFNVIFGQQEFQREVMRRRHASWSKKSTNTKSASINRIEGTLIGDDILNPPFTHEGMEHFSDKRHEFGIGLDYFSQLGHQTANAEFDGRFLLYNQSLEDIQHQTNDGRNEFDCAYRGDANLPDDILQTGMYSDKGPSSSILQDRDWNDTPLYTNLCMAQVPVMIHHNGDKGAREYTWPQVWFQPHAQELMDTLQNRGKQFGANTDSGGFVDWGDLCPADYSSELFRDHAG